MSPSWNGGARVPRWRPCARRKDLLDHLPRDLQVLPPGGCSSEETLFCLTSPERVFSRRHGDRLTEALRGLADLLLAGGNFNYRPHFFSPGRAYYGQTRRCGRPGTASPPCKSASVVSCSGCCDRTRSPRSRLQVMCFHKAAERKCSYMVWSLFTAGSFTG